jgi:phosphomannomutase
MLAEAMTGGLCSMGIEVIDVGLVITPSVGVMLRHLDCAGGVMITASHNPQPYNGIKLLLADGIAPPPEDASVIKNLYFAKNFATVDPDKYGKITTNLGTYDFHISRVLSLIDPQAISAKSYRVVLDSVNGSGGPITKKLLAQLGCETISINDEPSGLFEHTPEPTKENLTALCEITAKKRADVGFAQDPDADRLAIVDEKGNYIGEEYTLALAAKYIYLSKKGPATTNLSTSRMIDDIAEESGTAVFRTAVGEANVAAAMREHQCVIGGEGNGGVIDLRVGPVRDSMVAIALVLGLMAETGKKISELVSEIGGYYMHKEKFACDKQQALKIIQKVRSEFSEGRINDTDGCRIDFDNGWLHLRTSNTEPVMRLIVEAVDESAAKSYITKVGQIRDSVVG